MTRVALQKIASPDEWALDVHDDLFGMTQKESAKSASSADAFMSELCATQAMRRLEHIGFLGAVEFLQSGNGQEAHRRRHNRLEHSVGVARLAMTYAAAIELNEHATKTLVAAALLHDVGHGPLSHTLEPVFKAHFNLTHHKAGDAVLAGLVRHGKEVLEVLSAHDVDRDEVVSLLNGTAARPYAFMFSGPINFDTLEGITRSRHFSMPTNPPFPTEQIVLGLALQDADLRLMDAFWRLKGEMYENLIHSRVGLLMDAIAQAYMVERISQFHPSDFFRDERQLRRRHGGLFALLSSAKSVYGFMSKIPKRLFDEAVAIKKRRFYVDSTVTGTDPQSLKQRYQQTSSVRSVVVSELLPSKLNFEMHPSRPTQPDLIDGGYNKQSPRAI